MVVVNENKFIKQTKVLRLACYRAYKYQGTPEADCVFGFTEIKETCKHCVWLKIVDETRKAPNLLEEEVLNPALFHDLPRPKLELAP